MKPQGDVLKINSDGAFNPVTKSGGWGFVIRDSDGTVVHAGAGVVPKALDAFHVEVLGCLAGVQAACERGMSQVIAETDSMMLKMALDGDDFSLAPTGGLIHEIKASVTAYLSSFSVCFGHRLCNRVAHELAALGCKCSPNANLSWDGVPTGLESLVAGDLTVP